MHSADARAGEHGERCFRDHRHIDDDAVAGFHALLEQDGCECCDLVGHLRIGVGAFGTSHRAVVDQRGLVTPTGCDVAIEAVPGRVAFGACEPAAVLAHVGVEDAVPGLEPINRRCSARPKCFCVLAPRRIGFGVTARCRLIGWHQVPLGGSVTECAGPHAYGCCIFNALGRNQPRRRSADRRALAIGHRSTHSTR